MTPLTSIHSCASWNAGSGWLASIGSDSFCGAFIDAWLSALGLVISLLGYPTPGRLGARTNYPVSMADCWRDTAPFEKSPVIVVELGTVRYPRLKRKTSNRAPIKRRPDRYDECSSCGGGDGASSCYSHTATHKPAAKNNEPRSARRALLSIASVACACGGGRECAQDNMLGGGRGGSDWRRSADIVAVVFLWWDAL